MKATVSIMKNAAPKDRPWAVWVTCHRPRDTPESVEIKVDLYSRFRLRREAKAWGEEQRARVERAAAILEEMG